MNSSNDRSILLEIHDLSVRYKTRLGELSAVDHASFNIYQGEILGMVGESGCGKSTLGKALLRMLPPQALITGQMLFEGEDICSFSPSRIRDFRGRKASMIFQDPMTSLNPVQRVDDHIIEAIQVHEARTRKPDALKRASSLVERLGIQARRMADYPHQLSGGMRQRVMIGLGLVLNANLIIADEATTSLDVIVEAKLLDELRQIQKDFGISLLAITHNIALVAEIADRVVVMYAGKIVEIGSVYDIFDKPLHPYTRGLMLAVPSIQLDEREELYKMTGEPPNLTHPPAGCRFHPRCPKAMPICQEIEPDFLNIRPDHQVQCWLYQVHPEQTAATVKV
jgi:peptide/nickel transport system ATP-binding protein